MEDDLDYAVKFIKYTLPCIIKYALMMDEDCPLIPQHNVTPNTLEKQTAEVDGRTEWYISLIFHLFGFYCKSELQLLALVNFNCSMLSSTSFQYSTFILVSATKVSLKLMSMLLL